MKRLLVSSVALLLTTPLLAQSTSATTSSSKQVAAELVSMDKTAKTITIKTHSDPATAAGKTLVAKVDDKALPLLDIVKPGEKVTLTCLADKDHECETVTGIKKTPPKPDPEE
jgi:hypothetical protein